MYVCLGATMARVLRQSKRGEDSSTAPVTLVAVDQVLSLCVLGTMSISFRGKPVKIKSLKSCAILAHLALSENLQETRDRLVGLFWSETAEEKARASLRQTFSELRRVCAAVGFGGLHIERDLIALERGSIDVDLWTIFLHAKAGSVHPLLVNTPRLMDKLLEGFEDLDGSFGIWLAAKRQTLREQLLQILECGLTRAELTFDVRCQIARGIVNLDPGHEPAHRFLMRSKAEAGDIAGALRLYKMLWDLLDEEYGEEPSVATQQLVVEIKSRKFGSPSFGEVLRPAEDRCAPRERHSESRAEPCEPRIRLACMAAQTNFVDANKSLLVDRFRQHLIACLVRFREWRVVDRADTPKSTDDGRAASAGYGLEFVAYDAGDAAHVILTLKNVDTDVCVWSERVQLELLGGLDALSSLVRRVAMRLNVYLSSDRLRRFAGKPDVSLDAYDRWLRGQMMMLSFQPADHCRAASIFQDIIQDAPDFSPAYSALVQVRNLEHIVSTGVFRDPERGRETLALARRATQLDPVDSRAELSVGWSLAMLGLFDQAEAHASVAVELNDCDSCTLTLSALIYAYAGKRDRAYRLAQQALDVLPAPGPAHWAYHAVNRFLWGDHEGCAHAAGCAQDVLVGMHGWRLAGLFHAGNDRESVEASPFMELIRSKWIGDCPPTDENITRWLFHQYPIRRPEDKERLRAGLAAAGFAISHD
jgi:DNA-binding SARP family transcriptional activator